MLPISIIYLISEFDFNLQCKIHPVLPIKKQSCTTGLLKYCCKRDLIHIFKYVTEQGDFSRREIEDAFETAMIYESEEIAFHLYETVEDLDIDLIYESMVRCIQKKQVEIMYKFLNHRDMDISIEMFYWAILSQDENLIQYLQDYPSSVRSPDSPLWRMSEFEII